MPATMIGDFSKFPVSIQEPFRYVVGETVELHNNWFLLSYLCMDHEKLTELLAERFGPHMAKFQKLLEDEIFLSIVRLTDKNQGLDTTLSIWSLNPEPVDTNVSEFRKKTSRVRKEIDQMTKNLRIHRNKRLAHFDLDVSLKKTSIPSVKYSEMRDVVLKFGEFVNLFYEKYEQTTFMFSDVDTRMMMGLTECTAYKARAYDLLENSGIIPMGEWQRLAKL